MEPGLTPRFVEESVLAFLLERGYGHAAFALEHESRLGGLDALAVPAGQLERLLGKALRVLRYEREAVGATAGEEDAEGELRRFVDETIGRELALLAPAPPPPTAAPAARNRLFRRGSLLAVFTDDFRLFGEAELARAEGRQQLALAEVAPEFVHQRWEAFPFPAHLFLARGGELHVFARPGLARTRVLRAGPRLGADARCELHCFPAFYVAQFEAGQCLLDPRSAAPLRWLPFRADKLAALGARLYALDLRAQTLGFWSAGEGRVALELPAAARLANFEAAQPPTHLVALLQRKGETVLAWFAAGARRAVGETRVKGVFGRARFADGARLLLLGESSLAVLDLRSGRVEHRRQLRDRIVAAELAGARAVLELAGNAFVSFPLAGGALLEHGRAAAHSHMLFAAGPRALVELGAETLTAHPLPA